MSQTFRKELSTTLLTNRMAVTQNRDPYDFSSLDNDEEIKEITLQLVMIRKAYDYVLHQNSQKREQIELMKKQILKLESTTETCTEDQSSISSRIIQLSKEFGVYRQRLEKEVQDSKTLEFVHNRTKNDLLGLEMKSLTLHSSLSSLKTNLKDYESKSRKNKEQNCQSQRVLKDVSDTLKAEKKNKEDLVKRLEKAANSKKQASERRQQRIVKQAEIAEVAANQNRNAEEIALKEQIFVYKMYWMLLNYKQEKAFRDSEDAEEAFKRIRVATGLSNIQTVTEGFIKRDELGAELQKSISDQDNQLTVLKKKCEKVRGDLNRILLISKESSRPYFTQLQELNKQIELERKVNRKLVSSSGIYEKLDSDLQKIISKARTRLNISASSSNLEVLLKVKDLSQEVTASKEEHRVEVERLELSHISNLLKNVYSGKDFETKKESVLVEEQYLSLEDIN